MTTQDRDRLKVLHKVKTKHITQKEAGEQLGFDESQSGEREERPSE
jgi:hypothetical protein